VLFAGDHKVQFAGKHMEKFNAIVEMWAYEFWRAKFCEIAIHLRFSGLEIKALKDVSNRLALGSFGEPQSFSTPRDGRRQVDRAREEIIQIGIARLGNLT
jgi:hypothetical protein